MAELVETVADIIGYGTDVAGADIDTVARAAIRATLEAVIVRVTPTGYRSEDHFPSGVWSGRVQAADILRDTLDALGG